MEFSKPELREILFFTAAVAATIIVYLVLFHFLRIKAKKKERWLAGILTNYLYYPGLFLVIVISGTLTFPLLRRFFKESIYQGAKHFLLVFTIATFGFVIIKVLAALKEVAFHYYQKNHRGDIEFRKVNTKFLLIQRILNGVIILASIAGILLTFPNIRNMGATILASAGVVGIILGFAAQKSLGAFFGGIQIAIAQPIRIGDVVVVENQFGTISEITLTFVTVNTWDGRRLIVPVSYFLEKTFENWTRQTPEVIAKVKMTVSNAYSVDELREQFNSWIKDSPLWDKRSSGFVISDASDKSFELRATMSTKDSNDAWILECYIREKLVKYIQQHGAN